MFERSENNNNSRIYGGKNLYYQLVSDFLSGLLVYLHGEWKHKHVTLIFYCSSVDEFNLIPNTCTQSTLFVRKKIEILIRGFFLNIHYCYKDIPGLQVCLLGNMSCNMISIFRSLNFCFLFNLLYITEVWIWNLRLKIVYFKRKWK